MSKILTALVALLFLNVSAFAADIKGVIFHLPVNGLGERISKYPIDDHDLSSSFVRIISFGDGIQYAGTDKKTGLSSVSISASEFHIIETQNPRSVISYTPDSDKVEIGYPKGEQGFCSAKTTPHAINIKRAIYLLKNQKNTVIHDVRHVGGLMLIVLKNGIDGKNLIYNTRQSEDKQVLGRLCIDIESSRAFPELFNSISYREAVITDKHRKNLKNKASIDKLKAIAISAVTKVKTTASGKLAEDTINQKNQVARINAELKDQKKKLEVRVAKLEAERNATRALALKEVSMNDLLNAVISREEFRLASVAVGLNNELERSGAYKIPEFQESVKLAVNSNFDSKTLIDLHYRTHKKFIDDPKGVAKLRQEVSAEDAKRIRDNFAKRAKEITDLNNQIEKEKEELEKVERHSRDWFPAQTFLQKSGYDLNEDDEISYDVDIDGEYDAINTNSNRRMMTIPHPSSDS